MSEPTLSDCPYATFWGWTMQVYKAAVRVCKCLRTAIGWSSSKEDL